MHGPLTTNAFHQNTLNSVLLETFRLQAITDNYHLITAVPNLEEYASSWLMSIVIQFGIFVTQFGTIANYRFL